MKQTKSGFTLIEVMISLLIVAILATIAINSYRAQTRKGRRSDGINTIFSISLAEERHRSNNAQYGTLAQVWGGITASPQGYYSLSITNTSATGYTISAQAQGAQANDTENGTSCTTLQLTASSGTITKSPSVCWPQ
jgi:type IV pilus assembly protein PilE